MDKPWLQEYPPGVPAEIDVNRFHSIADILDNAFERFSARPAYANMGVVISYLELDRLSMAFANYLVYDLGLKRGDRVALMMPNILQYPVCLFGLLRAGMIAVNVNPLYTPRELEHQLKDSGATAIVILANFAHTLEQCILKTPLEHVMITQLGDLFPLVKRTLINNVVKYVKRMVPAFSLPLATPLNQALARGKQHHFRPVELNHQDIAFLQYTGGTTGVAKGAILTHGNIVANVLQAQAWIGGTFQEGKEIAIAPLPLYHIFSLTANCLFMTLLGSLNVLITNPRDMPAFVAELKKWPFTFITGVNTLFAGLLNQPNLGEVDFSNVKICLGGGMAVTHSVAESWHNTTGKVLLEAYGLTETSPAACINPVSLKAYNGLIGLPIPSTLVCILDEDEKPVPQGERGELCIKGPQVTQGYHNLPEETAKLFSKDGWLKTGDIAIMTETGYVKIVDRKKDMILVSGFNVYPNEIEDVVDGMEGVREVAAVGVLDEKTGEAVKLFVVKSDPKLTKQDIQVFCKKQLTAYKRPKFIEFIDELPKSNVGKILRRPLRDRQNTASPEEA